MLQSIYTKDSYRDLPLLRRPLEPKSARLRVIHLQQLTPTLSALNAPIELRLRNATLSQGARTLIYLYIGELRDINQFALWYKWLFDMQRTFPGISSIGDEIAMLTGAGGLPPVDLLMLLPRIRAGSPTADPFSHADFYTVKGDKVTIKRGFCGDYEIRGRSQVAKKSFNVTITG